MDYDANDEIMRAVLEESLRTAAEEDERRRHGSEQQPPVSESEVETPSAPALQPSEQLTQGEGGSHLAWEQQRLEALRQQRQRWEQLHGQHAQQEYHQHAGLEHPAQYPSVPRPLSHAAAAAGTAQYDSSSGLYPPIPSTLSDLAPPQQQQQAAETAVSEQQRRLQEEEDHRLAMQLAEAFAQEDAGITAAVDNGSDDDGIHREGREDDSDWEQVMRTASMQQQQPGATNAREAGAAAAAAGPGPDSSGSSSNSNSNRPSSQTAAAAGSGMGGLVGAGLSALLAMATHAASGSRSDADTAAPAAAAPAAAAAHTAQAAYNAPGSAAAATGSTTAAQEATATATSSSSSSSSQPPGFLNFAASALRNYLAGSRQASSSSSATAGTGAGTGGNSSGGSSSGRQWPPRADGRPGPDDLLMLQQLMQQLMTGAPPTAAAGAAGSRAGQGSGPGFRVVHLPGGGFAATYSSSRQFGSGSSSSSQQQQTQQPDGPFQDEDDPFGFMRGGNDLFSQLLLAGARSAHGNHSRQQGSGFTHFDPAVGPQGRYEPMGVEGSAAGLEELIGALMGQGMFGGEGGGLAGFRYEDLAGLDPVHVSTPEDVLASLPRSEYVDGRKPGDSDTCVICQTPYAAGDQLMHLPCLHAFHADCITPWLQAHSKKCPVCKTDVC